MFPGITQPFEWPKWELTLMILVSVILILDMLLMCNHGDFYDAREWNWRCSSIWCGLSTTLPDETLAGDQELSLSRTKKDSATIGRYFVNTPNIDIEFTSGERSGLFKYNFHSGDKANVLVNASHHLSAPKRPQWTQHFVKGSIKTKTTMDILVKLPLKVVGVINLIGQFTSVVNLMLILLKLPVC